MMFALEEKFVVVGSWFLVSIKSVQRIAIEQQYAT